ncbi:DUF3761 domain-containing protein [Pantoea sp. GL120224-02]|uniref:DUF3761 domain-containing protein n=1 Tax=Pantoea sp. GL120224-02 TaxID=1378084 RepID=UPI000BE40E21|nr:DUF3761 domain-containing protein [Pantoea sp. GL120224-02]
MKTLSVITLMLLLVSMPTHAKKHVELIEQGNYINSEGQSIHRPAYTQNNDVPDGATARCRDGSYSFSTHHRGTCSRHGGVAEWLAS